MLACATVSIVTVTVALAVLPKSSLAVTSNTTGPSGIGVFGVTLQVPSPVTLVINTSPVGLTTVIVAPGVPVPITFGVFWFVIRSVRLALSEAGSSLAVTAMPSAPSTTGPPWIVSSTRPRPVPNWNASGSTVSTIRTNSMKLCPSSPPAPAAPAAGSSSSASRSPPLEIALAIFWNSLGLFVTALSAASGLISAATSASILAVSPERTVISRPSAIFS